ncbi:MAG: hypothetical protein E7017_00040 [Alphaproteobacteria bacterium]|nr:hypothetical protein [Alphaproteobacteria bacterium]
MRIVGGKYRGKKLISPMSQNVRPTSDKAREALFNILRSRLGGNYSKLKLLDIFSGSGAFGLEAISQGFAEVALIDIDTRDLQKNVDLFVSEKNKIKVVRADITNDVFLSAKYDVLFSDAPYNKGLTEKALEKIYPFLNNGALCFIELEKNEQCTLPHQYTLLDERNYGAAKVMIVQVTS